MQTLKPDVFSIVYGPVEVGRTDCSSQCASLSGFAAFLMVDTSSIPELAVLV